MTGRRLREHGLDPARHQEQPAARVLGVIGTMVWDTIWRSRDVRSPTEEWGGISYALAAADAMRPIPLRVRPILKLGRDLSEAGFRFLHDLPVVENVEHVAVVESPNPRVELRYEEGVRRCERITGGVPPWSWPELEPRIRGCDALYVNFITGDELGLEVAKTLRRQFRGPIYVDIHSLLLARGPGGERSPRPLMRWAEWLRCFDAVQVNEAELGTLSKPWGDPWAFAAEMVGREPALIFVTLGERGAAYIMAADALPLRDRFRPSVQIVGPVQTGKVAAVDRAEGDPTGCGDVWGMTAFCLLLEGASVEEAIRQANTTACRNVGHRGASGLNRYLRGEIEGR